MCRLQIVSSRSKGITALVLAVLLMAATRLGWSTLETARTMKIRRASCRESL